MTTASPSETLPCDYDLARRVWRVPDKPEPIVYYDCHYRVDNRHEVSISCECPCDNEKCPHVRHFFNQVIRASLPSTAKGIRRDLRNLKLWGRKAC